MKIVNIDGENLHISWGISMKFSEKMRLLIILKVKENQDFTLSLEDTFLEKPQGGRPWGCGGGGELTSIPNSLLRVKQHLSKTWRSIHEKSSNIEAELKKSVS